jgi:hypothetical protein
LGLHPWYYVLSLHWQHRSGFTGVCILAEYQVVTYWMKYPSIGLILIPSPLAVLDVCPEFGGVE